MIFLTYNDSPGGVYYSQVIAVCKYWEDTFKERVQLVAFISLRDFATNKAKILTLYPDSFVLPMFPGINNWRLNVLRLKIFMLFRKKQTVIARGVFATLLALKCGKFNKVCFDARGAYDAEWNEYLKNDSPTLAAQMNGMEKEALLKSDFRIAVSAKLLDYWKEKFGYTDNKHVVIPCTLSVNANEISYDAQAIQTVRTNLKVADNDVLLVYSGSSAEWQSFNKLESYLIPAFTQNPNLKLLLLSKQDKESQLAVKFPERVIQTWVKFPEEVEELLSAADYGLLIRDASVTNKVSSPVKFAEYLEAGLPVIISQGIGDYSDFVKEKNCGIQIESVNWAGLRRSSEIERKQIQEIAKIQFTKAAYKEQYSAIRNA
jgi:hypothetical protein